MSASSNLRGEDEIQRAHDLLVGIILDECPPELQPKDEIDRQHLSGMASVLCWMLRHDHNKSFGDLLAGIDKVTTEAGWTINKPIDN
jgi:hypothetical protein